MAVGYPRWPVNAPPPFFGFDEEEQQLPAVPQTTPQPQRQPYLGFLDVAGQQQLGPGGVGADGTQAYEPPQLVEPLAQQQQAMPQGAMPAGGELPSEASIEARLKMAERLAGNQQEVNHPLQAIGNVVNTFAAQWLEEKARKDQEKIEQNRRKIYSDALSGDNTDLNQLANRLLASNDPKLVDQGLDIKLRLATQGRSRRDAPKVQDFLEGDQTVQKQWDDETGSWQEVGRGPRYRPQGSGGGDGPRKQQGGAVQLPNGKVVQAVFNPEDGGYYYRGPDGQLAPVPDGSRPVTPSAGAPLNQKQYNDARRALMEDERALQRLDKYMQTIGNTNTGWQRWADSVSANTKTLLGTGKVKPRYTPEELALMEARGELQGLLGLFRPDIVGPGVMTEYDALRIIQALGGDVTALQNPQVVRGLLQNVYAGKRQSADLNRDIVNRNAPTYGDAPVDINAPQSLEDRSQQPQQRTAPMKDGEVKVIGGKKYIRRGGRWYPA